MLIIRVKVCDIYICMYLYDHLLFSLLCASCSPPHPGLVQCCADVAVTWHCDNVHVLVCVQIMSNAVTTADDKSQLE
jgi:hypothetical protein